MLLNKEAKQNLFCLFTKLVSVPSSEDDCQILNKLSLLLHWVSSEQISDTKILKK